MDHKVELDAAGMTAVAHELGEHARVVEQQAGRGVWVPPGWLHWVYNIQSCFKVAFEVCPISHVAACCHMQQPAAHTVFASALIVVRITCRCPCSCSRS
jgi:hypothetical protein